MAHTEIYLWALLKASNSILSDADTSNTMNLLDHMAQVAEQLTQQAKPIAEPSLGLDLTQN